MTDAAPQQTVPSLGLALGGGGARGLAHVHVLAALDDLGIRPSAIVGCSIGALIGAPAAAGLSGAEIEDEVLAALGRPADLWGKIWKLRPRSLAEVVGGLPLFDPEAAIREFLPERVPDDFDDLPIPFSAVAADYYGAAEVEIGAGSLRRAVAASIALPALFRPVEIGGLTLIDGGVVNPLPFDKLPEDVGMIVAVDVVGMPVRSDKGRPPGAREALFGSSQILMQSLISEKLKSRQPDVLIRPPIDGIGVLDFTKAKDILAATACVREEVKAAIGRRLDAAA
ncbi:patatin-like phospholipase family protein [Pleomorphomonas sp. NRK KF1]|uniref:patatin-like phospholipase family protein n=1 Tax=Pleomorphomonas sp. NRK KF1 TaxID=2943000 RepID=UPI002043888A|nr:patatin-like phospholipase family protein [Pleomorphomonas sp. NRK KF1]MCM5553057.1 patatin-like phospholipase family protein [Pleomorphomonas sp. NRK KF1]